MSILNRFLISSAAVLTLSAADPFVGVWKLSHTRSSGSLPEDEIVTIQEQHGAMAVKVIVVNGPNHETFVIRFTAPLKGGPGHVESGPYDAVTVKRPNHETMEINYLSKGAEIRSTRVMVSRDGATMRSSGRVREGGDVWNMVFDKEPH